MSGFRPGYPAAAFDFRVFFSSSSPTSPGFAMKITRARWRMVTILTDASTNARHDDDNAQRVRRTLMV